MWLCNGVKLSGTRRPSLAVRRPAGPGSLLRLVSAGAGSRPAGRAVIRFKFGVVVSIYFGNVN